MAAALLAAMRTPQNGEFDPALAMKKSSSSAPSYSMRQKTLNRDWHTESTDPAIGMGTQLAGDLKRETEAVRETAPHFTMRPRPDIVAPPILPGPGSYSIPATVSSDAHPVTSNAPGWLFGSTERDKTFNGILAHSPKTPGPSEYNVAREGTIGRVDQGAVPAYSMRKNLKDYQDADYRAKRSPRPGAHEYDIRQDHVDLLTTKAPSFTMRLKNTAQVRDIAPAPDSYEISDVTGNTDHPCVVTGPGWQFDKTDRDKAVGGTMKQIPKTPSPMHYKVNQDNTIGRVNQESVPTYSMRAHLKDYQDAEYRQSRSPRPGAHDYDITQDHINLVRDKSPKYTIRSRPSSRIRSLSPAPGKYDNPSIVGNAHPVVSKAPVWGFGSTNRENAIGRILQFMPETPGPSNYRATRDNVIGRVDQESVPAYSMRAKSKDRRLDPQTRQKVSPRPGAADYNLSHDLLDLQRSSAPKYTMRGRGARSKSPQRGASRDKSPGPGCYDVPRPFGRSSSVSRGNSTSAWGFGSSKRFKDTKPDNRQYSY